MSSFSDRMGITKPKVNIQINSMDSELRNRLWNVFSDLLTKKKTLHNAMSAEMGIFTISLWDSFFKEPSDLIPKGWGETYQKIRYFFFNAPWHSVYNILEFTADNYPTKEKIPKFINLCNKVLETELSGFHFIGTQITPITSELEISAIEQALATPMQVVNSHIENALKLFSDKESPDYRNSIKESISAVEAVCRVIAGNENATLGDALNIIEKEAKINFNKALKRGFSSLYGYTSSADGIRHALAEGQANADFAVAATDVEQCFVSRKF
jgi:hypothetical protein